MSYEREALMDKIARNPLIAAIAAIAFLLLISSTFSIVPETRQGIVLRLSAPNRIINPWQPGEKLGNTGAGLIAKIPLFEDIIWIDKRILDIDMEPQEVLSTDQLRLRVDAYARFRVTDPLQMYKSARTSDNVANALKPIFGSALRDELGKRTFAELLSPERDQAMANIKKGLDLAAKQYGAQIVDVRIKRADLPSGTPLQSAFDSMKSARTQEALTIEAEGFREARVIRAEADAGAAKIYSAAYGKDPDFYDFYRAMESYRVTFGQQGEGQGKGSTNMILSPSNDYLRQFRGGR
jgi:modulator of FtsH protease HflC